MTIKVNVDKRIVAPGQKLYIHVTSPDRVGNNPMSITLGSLSIGSFTSDPTGNMFACIIVPSLPPGVQSLFVTSQLEGNASTGMTIVTTPTTGTQSCAIIGYNAPTFTKGQDGAFLPMSLKLYNNSDVQGTFRVGFVGRFSSAQSLAQDFSVPANSSFVYASARINSYDSVRVVITALNINTPTTTSPTQIIYLPITQGNSTTPIPIYQTGGDVPPIGNEPPPPPDAGSSFPWWLLLVGVLAGVASRGRGKKQQKKAGRYR